MIVLLESVSPVFNHGDPQVSIGKGSRATHLDCTNNMTYGSSGVVSLCSIDQSLGKLTFRITKITTSLLFKSQFLTASFYMGEQGWCSVRALAFHQCGPGSIPGLGVICGLSLSWFSSLLQEVFLRVLWFSPLLKNQHFQIPIRFGKCPQLVLCAKYIDT